MYVCIFDMTARGASNASRSTGLNSHHINIHYSLSRLHQINTQFKRVCDERREREKGERDREREREERERRRKREIE